MADSTDGLDLSHAGQQNHAILLHKDHTSDFHLSASHAAFYQHNGLRRVANNLCPRGILRYSLISLRMMIFLHVSVLNLQVHLWRKYHFIDPFKIVNLFKVFILPRDEFEIGKTGLQQWKYIYKSSFQQYETLSFQVYMRHIERAY